ncbi:hypothetical protein B0H19DRAFT_1237157 [Mycena capillaripes]|nr:hypothetical protein B0H19DRAFT_1237157 [Mycena capillaripes]
MTTCISPSYHNHEQDTFGFKLTKHITQRLNFLDPSKSLGLFHISFQDFWLFQSTRGPFCNQLSPPPRGSEATSSRDFDQYWALHFEIEFDMLPMAKALVWLSFALTE